MKTILKVIGTILLIIVIILAALLVAITLTEYKPASIETVEVQTVDFEAAETQSATEAAEQPASEAQELPADEAEEQPAIESAEQATSESQGATFTVVSMNVGYCGSGAECQWVLDGGKGNGTADSEAVVDKNLKGIIDSLRNEQADAFFFQEVDLDSARSKHINQVVPLAMRLDGTSYAYACNNKVPFLIMPAWPPAAPEGSINSGLETIATTGVITDATRESLPCPFSWPVRCLNLKRCLLVTHLDIPGVDRPVSLINFHLEAYSDDEGRIAQTKQLIETMERERAEGYYVICGGDWNQAFPDSEKQYPFKETTGWQPNNLADLDLPEGYRLAYTNDLPSCRLLNQPYDKTSPLNQYYVIDGFLVGDDVEVQSVSVIDTDFQFSDHNAVKLVVSFK